MEQDVQQRGDGSPSEPHGNAPADLHAYSHGRRMSRDAAADAQLAGHMKTRLDIDQQSLARALGWFSVALGVAEVVAPRQLGRVIGIDSNPNVLRALGLREIASGVGILTQRQHSGWLWSRVAGDAMDLALLGAAMTSDKTDRARLAAATAAVAGVTALDIYCSQQSSRNGADAAAAGSEQQRVRETVGVNASPEACYAMWRDLHNLPRFMRHVEAVHDRGNGQWHWTVKAPGGGTVEWDSRITIDEPNRQLAWETLPQSDVHNRGSVRFEPAPGGRGTVLSVDMSYVPPAGKLGAIAAKMTGEAPEQQVREDLRRFRQVMETGELATTEGQPTGRRSNVADLFRKASRP